MMNAANGFYVVELRQLPGGTWRADFVEARASTQPNAYEPVGDVRDWAVGTARSIPVAVAVAAEEHFRA